MEENNMTLPDECWATIFNQIHQGHDMESVSLVCKRFLLIVDSIQVNLVVTNPSIRILSRILQRFEHLKKIKLVGFIGDLNAAVLAIARSGLDLQELDLSDNVTLPTICFEELGVRMKNLKVLECSCSSLTDIDLVRIANSFPGLEELDISDSYFPHIVDGKTIAVTDDGIEILSSKLNRLKKIDISGNQCVSDKSLFLLAQNCVLLEEINVNYCGVTETGISFVTENCYQLKSLGLSAHFRLESALVNSSTNFLRNLESIRLASVAISDEVFKYIGKVGLPLRSFSLLFCKGYTFIGIKTFLDSYQSLTSLTLLGAEFLTDEHIQELSPFLQNITMIKLYYSPELSSSTYATLTYRCPQLECLELGETSIGKEEYKHEYDGPLKNFTMKSLNLSQNQYLSNSVIRNLFHIFRRIEKLDMSSCFQGEEELDVADILKYNSEIKSLMLCECRKLEFSRRDSEVSDLREFIASHSGINDQVLAMIGKACPNLVLLDVEDCDNITEEGVKEVVSTCKRLKYLSLRACSGVDPEIIEWIVSIRPSLRRIVSSSHLYPKEEQQEHFLQQGCLVYKGRDYEEFV